ncbi:MAG: hypothetical protein KDB73_13225 [Planctomycetes bacterium]|nr:hypothetical protein [Planctomycetota bacterium]
MRHVSSNVPLARPCPPSLASTGGDWRRLLGTVVVVGVCALTGGRSALADDPPAPPPDAPVATPETPADQPAPAPAPVSRQDFPAPPPPRGVLPVGRRNPVAPSPVRPVPGAPVPRAPVPGSPVPRTPGAPLPGGTAVQPQPQPQPVQPASQPRPQPAPAPGPGEIPDPWAVDPAADPLDVPFPDVPGAWVPERDGPLPVPQPAAGPDGGADDPFWNEGGVVDAPDVPLLEGAKPALPTPGSVEPPPADGGPAGATPADPLPSGAGGADPVPSDPAAAGTSATIAPLGAGTAAPADPTEVDWAARYPDVGLELPTPGEFPRLAGMPAPSSTGGPTRPGANAPGTTPDNPWMPGAPTVDQPTAPEAPTDPWMPGAPTVDQPGTPASPTDPWMPGVPEQGPGPATTQPGGDDTALGDDPWGFGTGSTTKPVPAPGTMSPPDRSPPDRPAPDSPSPGTTAPAPYDPWGSPLPEGAGTADGNPGRAPSGDSPWDTPLPGTSPGAGTAPPPGASAPYVGTTPAQRAREHALRLRDLAGDPSVVGYPADLLLRSDPRIALRPGSRAAVVAFVDDANRASDLAAAALLPSLVGYGDRFDFVVVEARPRGPDDASLDALRRAFLRDVPTVVVLPPDRRAPRLFSGRIDAAEVELALVEALRMPAASPDDTGTGPTSTPPEYRDPSSVGPDGWAPGGTAPPADPMPPLPGGIGLALDAHVKRLRQVAGDARVPGYPAALVRASDARIVREPGQRPVVIIFYDDSSKASDLQAADFLPVLVNRAGDIDVVTVDVSVRARWDTFQKQVVHTYYMSFVPTTVVLTARRVPVKSWYQRVTGEQLQQAIDESLRRR